MVEKVSVAAGGDMLFDLVLVRSCWRGKGEKHDPFAGIIQKNQVVTV